MGIIEPTTTPLAQQVSILLSQWQRIIQDSTPIYIQPDLPDWFVPSARTDHLLQALAKSPSAALPLDNNDQTVFELNRLCNFLGLRQATKYTGRAAELNLARLKECWFHLTDKCNLSCHHCLFGASPALSRSLSPDNLKNATNEALELGCRLFYFTGGEPFIYPDFFQYLDTLFEHNDVHAVILTNGMLLHKHITDLHNRERLHLQVSLDGLQQAHDSLRGRGSFTTVLKNLQLLQQEKIPVTLSIAISRINIHDLPEMVRLAADNGVTNIHLLYHFVRGKGTEKQFIPPAEIFPSLRAAWCRAEQLGIRIDNVETMRNQIFSTPGTRHDLSNTGWESLAVGPDAHIYPSPALVGMDAVDCGNLADGLTAVWHNSRVLTSLRESSLIHSAAYQDNPLKFLIGGGDCDHSFMTGDNWVGSDPYVELYNHIGLQLIADQAGQYREPVGYGIRLCMGDVRHDCPEDDGHGTVVLTHCNCVISVASDDGHGSVREFYGRAALIANEDIINPLAPAQKEANFIPLTTRKHSYGCGSPVTDALLKQGETLVDLGSGSGIECFMAAKEVGERGRVIGLDMTDEMLALANTAKTEVCHKLGYSNINFCKGFLEQIPLATNLVDVVISNCVINLSPDKRKTYEEIFRTLKPGGRLVVSDIVTDTPIPSSIQNNIKYRGECLGGAMQQEQLVAMMEAAGFSRISFIKRFPYRTVEGMDFFSLTYLAWKLPETPGTDPVEVIYRGPHNGIYSQNGVLLIKGRRTVIPAAEVALLGNDVFVLDGAGAVTNVVMENSCCSVPPEKQGQSNCCEPESDNDNDTPLERKNVGCMVCGKELQYFTNARQMQCTYCGNDFQTNGCCLADHFVCDRCHSKDAMAVIKSLCTTTKERDLLKLLLTVRSHPAIPMHGPEHHALIPGIILACYRNSGGTINDSDILAGIERGSAVPGGTCGFWGSCGAAIGVGIALSLILEATPVTPSARQQAQQCTARILTAIGRYKGGRCCQRETWVALTEIAALSNDFLPSPLMAETIIACEQYSVNKECIAKQCPLWESRQKEAADSTLVFL